MTAGKPDRNLFKRQTAIVLILLFWGLAAILIYRTAHTYFLHRLIPAIPGAFLLLMVAAVIVANKIAVVKYGEAEKEDQARDAARRKHKIQNLKKTEGYKRRRYTNRLIGILILVFTVLSIPIAGFIVEIYHTPEYGTFYTASAIDFFAAYIVAIKMADKKFGKK
jgi:hypothetical protein